MVLPFVAVVVASIANGHHFVDGDKIDDDDLLNRPHSCFGISVSVSPHFGFNDDFFFSEGIKGSEYYK